MPTYEYKCDACGNAFEKFQSMSAAPVKKCPKCGKNKVRRLISTGAGLIFKGSGFYITDYRSEGYKSDAKSDSGGESKGGEAKTGDSKPAESKQSESTPSTPAAAPAASAPAESKPAKSKMKSE